MTATPDGKPFDDPGWLFEIKHDGYRIIAYISKGDVRLKTRKNIDYTTKFPLIVDALRKWKAEAVLDGEIVVLNSEGVSDFNALQNYRGGEVYYYVFDLLYLNGKDYTKLPLLERKAKLKKVLPKSGFIRFCDHIVSRGASMFEAAKAAGAEGLIAKRADSLYRPGMKSRDWLKIKVMKEEVFTIAGIVLSGNTIGALILSDNGKYAGDVGTGWDAQEVKEILSRVKVLKNSPVKSVRKGVVWVKPEIRCTVRYLERTAAGELRHASFRELI